MVAEEGSSQFRDVAAVKFENPDREDPAGRVGLAARRENDLEIATPDSSA